MDATQYKDYVLFMLFIKYVSDKYGNSKDFAPPIVIPAGAGFPDMVALKGNPEIGDLINTQIIQPLVDANNQQLARTDFPDFNDPNKLGEGDEKVKRLENLIAIFESPDLDFSNNRAEHDDILGDAYEYLMRHFATQSGKSKGQFYTPSEVSRIIASVIGISPENAIGRTSVYDPTCGSGSLLLKVAAQAGKQITLEGQEKDVTTAGLARMNMILHDFPGAKILAGNTLSTPKFLDGQSLRTYDYVVANPPFSDKTWSAGVKLKGEGNGDPHSRWDWGNPPRKQGDYAYLLHIIRAMKSNGKGACILPHGVLFRGNAEADIRTALVKSGYLKGIIGLPPNLFFGTGIPACILVLDKENAASRKGIFMIDASKGFIKDGPKNRLREQDLHRITDTFTRGQDIHGYARMVPYDEIADDKNAFNLNLPRYLPSAEAEDLQDISAHLHGGLPQRDIDALGAYWQVMPALRAAMFTDLRPGYQQLGQPQDAIKPLVLTHPEFTAFTTTAAAVFADWRNRTTPQLRAFTTGHLPKSLIHTISEDLLNAYRATPLVNPYDIFQHLMEYWADPLQDDLYLISDHGWVAAATPREIVKIKNKEGKLVWPEPGDILIGKRRFTSDLIPAALIVARYFAPQQAAIDAQDARIAELEAALAEAMEDGAGEDGLLAEVIIGDGDAQKITTKAVKDRIKALADDLDAREEIAALKHWLGLDAKLSTVKAARKAAEIALHKLVYDRFAALTEAEVQALAIDDKWMAHLGLAVEGELDRVSQTLTGRVRQLADRYATPLPELEADAARLATRVAGHLARMGIAG